MPPALLIRGPKFDSHTRGVSWALRQRGADPFHWSSASFPVEQTLSVEIDASGAQTVCLSEALERRALAGFDVVWNRRHGPPTVSPAIEAEEKPFAERESRTLLSAVLEQLGRDALWINSLDAQRRDLDKPFQLRTAAKVGLAIPPSLFSNDPDTIAAFYDRHNGEVIYKPFAPGKWDLDSGGVALTYTTPLPRRILAQREMLANAPGIYQKKLDKRDEWRLTVFGRTCFAARLLSQDRPEGRMDWRAAQSVLEIEPRQPPDWLRDAVFRYMDAAGLRFATFDFVRTPSDAFVFLECNQTGQFLWKEELQPDMPLLAAFTDFLLSGEPRYQWPGAPVRPRFADFTATSEFDAIEAAVQAGYTRAS